MNKSIPILYLLIMVVISSCETTYKHASLNASRFYAMKHVNSGIKSRIVIVHGLNKSVWLKNPRIRKWKLKGHPITGSYIPHLSKYAIPDTTSSKTVEKEKEQNYKQFEEGNVNDLTFLQKAKRLENILNNGVDVKVPESSSVKEEQQRSKDEEDFEDDSTAYIHVYTDLNMNNNLPSKVSLDTSQIESVEFYLYDKETESKFMSTMHHILYWLGIYLAFTTAIWLGLVIVFIASGTAFSALGLLLLCYLVPPLFLLLAGIFSVLRFLPRW